MGRSRRAAGVASRADRAGYYTRGRFAVLCRGTDRLLGI